MVPPLLVPKARRPKFDLTLRILDLNNIPLTTGTSLIKYTLPSHSTPSTSHTGHTPSVPITSHTATYNHTITLPLRLSISSKSNTLSECPLSLEILQDFSNGHLHHGKSEKVTLGSVELNLAEYVEASEDGEVVRRYLLRDSKVNSTLRVGVHLRFVEGERGFSAPALRSAAVFGGIAGVMEGGDDSVGHLPTLNLSKPPNNSELSDIYRRSLAASWAAQAGELPADECVEDIFNGGDGFKPSHPHHHNPHPSNIEHSSSLSSEDHGHGHSRHHSRQHSGASERTMKGRHHGRKGSGGSEVFGKKRGGIGGDGVDEDGEGRRGRTGLRAAREVDEFEVREDLIAWRLPGTPGTTGAKV